MDAGTPRAANLGLTAVVFLLNWSLSSATAILALAVSLRPPALARGLGLPMVVQIIAGIVILDFSAGYLAHRALHLFPVLWWFHRVQSQRRLRGRHDDVSHIDDLRPDPRNLHPK